jgi:predicted MPP superfamily phosphohydrolase
MRRTAPRAGAGAGAAGAIGLAAWAWWIEPRRLVVRHRELRLPGWPAALDGMRVAVLGDLHVGAPHVDRAKVERIVRRLNSEQPDWVALLGDFVIDRVLFGTFVGPEVTARRLEKIEAPAYAVLGNNDDERVRRALEAVGISVLDNQAATISWRGQTLWIVGIADARTARPNVRAALADVGEHDPVVALTHSPDLFPLLPSRISLTLAGHTHGAQINLPVLRQRVTPSWFGGRYVSGHIEEGGRHLFVHSGIGTSRLPVRFRAPPQITILRLRS